MRAIHSVRADPFTVSTGARGLTRKSAEVQWQLLYHIAAWVSVVAVGLIPISITVFIIWPPPETVIGHFVLLQEHWWLGLLGLDLIYLVANTLLLPMILALYLALRRVNESLMLLGITLVLIGTVALLTSNPLVEMWTLSNRYAAATTTAERTLYLTAGEVYLTGYTGTAYHAHYILGSIGLLLMALVMLRSPLFGRVAAYTGIVANIVAFGLYVPVIGVALSTISGIAYLIWFVLIIRRLFQLSTVDSPGDKLSNGSLQ
ncbi:MAG: hypothetical protein R3C14_15805 [Caldilineaceae bacterium]